MNIENVWPEWKVSAIIGQGSYGTIYKVVHSEDGIETFAAVKVISVPSSQTEVNTLREEGMSSDQISDFLYSIVQDFVNEIQVIKELRGSRNIVRIDACKILKKEAETGWDIYIRMELLTPLYKYVKGHNLSEGEVIRLGMDICSALEICEQKNIIYRDIKPKNIFVDYNGYFKLGEYRISEQMEHAASGLSGERTFGYMAPEVVKGLKYDSSADIYSLGIVLYSFLNENRLPFIQNEKQWKNAESRTEAEKRRLSGEKLPVPLHASPELSSVILTAAAYNPEKRFKNASAFKNALATSIQDTDSTILRYGNKKTGSFIDIKNVWPEWKIVKKLGQGSYGSVYKAVRTEYNLKSFAAVKIISIPSQLELDSLRSEGMTEENTRDYLKSVVMDFVNEIQIMENLKGAPNTVNIEDYKVIEKQEEIGWDIFIRMELLTPLYEYMQGRELTESEAIHLGIDLCSALEICEKKHIIHRDIKPENIFVNEYGDFKLGDFGIARKLENLSANLSKKGTASYMAPEIELGREYNASVDVYSLGLVLYKLMNHNRLPFLETEQQRSSLSARNEAFRRRISGEPLPLPCNASENFGIAILQACAFDPSRRFKTAADLKNALQVCNAENESAMDKPKDDKGRSNKQSAGITEEKPEKSLKPIQETPVEKTVRKDSFNIGKDDKGISEKEGAKKHSDKISRKAEDDKEKQGEKKKIKLSGVLAAGLIVILICIIAVFAIRNRNHGAAEQASEQTSEASAFADAEIGDTITFGNYEQDGDTSKAEPIEWVVLDKTEDKLLVITKYIVDCQPYNEVRDDTVTWKTCSLRTWLNNDFLNKAFTQEETEKIVSAVNEDDAEDQVFILSKEEVNKYYTSDDQDQCGATPYIREQSSIYINRNTGNSRWWLRDIGASGDLAMNVYSRGHIDSHGRRVSHTYIGVRPALYITLKS